MNTYILAHSRPWGNQLFHSLCKNEGAKFHFIASQDELSLSKLKEISPRYVFLPHWSFFIPKEIYSNFECVIFHMTDLPFGRGGSPLQNLIARKIYETQITALQCVEKLDAGPIYMKRPLSLHGNAEEIYLRASDVIVEMILDMIATEPTPKQQEGEPVLFKRRTPEESNGEKMNNLTDLFNLIRMLDVDDYPKAFFDVGNFRLKMSRAALKQGKIIADVEITEKDHE
ncbi:MAG: hypothetical protein ACRC2T_03450 [Thermoguttaceae bacterium]